MAPPLLTCGLYLFGTTLLLPGTILLLPTGPPGCEVTAIVFLIAACTTLTIAALIDLAEAGSQVPRPPMLVPVCMVLGGVFFLAGAVLYWPAWAGGSLAGSSWTVARFGTWVFRTGTCAYLVGSFACVPALVAGTTQPKPTNARESARYGLGGIASYIVGAMLYFAGGVLSECGMGPTGAWLWVIGSGWFVLGAFLLLLSAGVPPTKLDEERPLLGAEAHGAIGS